MTFLHSLAPDGRPAPAPHHHATTNAHLHDPSPQLPARAPRCAGPHAHRSRPRRTAQQRRAPPPNWPTHAPHPQAPHSRTAPGPLDADETHLVQAYAPRTDTPARAAGAARCLLPLIMARHKERGGRGTSTRRSASWSPAAPMTITTSCRRARRCSGGSHARGH